jgi:AAA family ATP:ADP antiporter
VVAEGAVGALRLDAALARRVLTADWIAAAVRDRRPARRVLAAQAIGICRVPGTGLKALLADDDPEVVAAAFSAAAALGDRGYVHSIALRLADASVRRAAVAALASFGPAICGTLGDLLEDEAVAAAVRRQIPRVLRLVPSQRSVDALLRSIGHPDIAVRAAVLRALGRLRDKAPELDYGGMFVSRQILAEARHYFELHAALLPILKSRGARSATGLLARSLEQRSADTVERLFRLLGLRYPPRDIDAAYRSLRGTRTDGVAVALEFLENILDPPLRRVVLPLLESPGRLVEKGQDLFGVEPGTAEDVLRELLRSADPWLVACAAAAAAEQGFEDLLTEIKSVCETAGGDVAAVARSAATALLGGKDWERV